MRSHVRAALVLTAVAAVTLLPTAAAGQQWLNEDSGYSERSWLFKTKPPNDLMFFTWQPELPFGSTLYFVTGQCNQYDDFGLLAGKNTVTFKNVQMVGVDSENAIGAVQQKEKIKKGEGKQAVWDLTPLASSFETDRSVIVGAEVAAKKKLGGFHSIACKMAVLELLDPNSLATASEAARLSYLEEVLEARSARVMLEKP